MTTGPTPPSKILVRYLVASLIGNLPPNNDWPIFQGFMPDGKGVPDDCIAVYDTTGVQDGRYLRGGPNSEVDHPGIQIRIRCSDPDNGWTRARLIAEILATTDRAQVDVNGSIYTILATSQSSPVANLGPEQRGSRRRSIIVLNYLATFSGDVLMLVSFTTHAADATLTSALMKGNYHTNGAAGASQIVLTLPPAAEGLNANFLQVDAGALIVRPQAGEQIIWDGGQVPAGVGLSLQNTLSTLKLVSDGNGRWLMESAFGVINEES